MKVLSGEKILIATSSFSAVDTQPLEMLRNSGCEIIDNPYKRRLAKAELLELLAQGITGMIAGVETLDKQVLAKSALKVISRCGSGMSNVDLDAAKNLGIVICHTPDAPVDSVAELTLAAMLCLLRMLPVMNNDLHLGKWNKKTGALLKGKIVLIIGFGRIGKRVYELLVPFKVRVLIVDPFIKNNTHALTTLSLKDALPQADVVTIHSGSNGCIIGKDEFALMKPGALLLNASRGILVDENTLVKALEEKRIGGAWLDVFNDEPYSGPLVNFQQVILTPHAGSYTQECRRTMELEAVNNLIKAFKKIKEGKN